MNTRTFSATFTRPSDTTQYASGDLVANSVNDSTAAYMTFANVAIGPGRGFKVKRVRIKKSDTDVTSAAFRLHLFSAAPTFTSAGDNSAIASVLQGAANWLGSLDVTAMISLQDGDVGQGLPVSGAEIFVRPGDDLNLYGLLEARGTYTPASAEVFIVYIEVEYA